MSNPFGVTQIHPTNGNWERNFLNYWSFVWGHVENRTCIPLQKKSRKRVPSTHPQKNPMSMQLFAFFNHQYLVNPMKARKNFCTSGLLRSSASSLRISFSKPQRDGDAYRPTKKTVGRHTIETLGFFQVNKTDLERISGLTKYTRNHMLLLWDLPQGDDIPKILLQLHWLQAVPSEDINLSKPHFPTTPKTHAESDVQLWIHQHLYCRRSPPTGSFHLFKKALKRIWQNKHRSAIVHLVPVAFLSLFCIWVTTMKYHFFIMSCGSSNVDSSLFTKSSNMFRWNQNLPRNESLGAACTRLYILATTLHAPVRFPLETSQDPTR